MATNMTTIRIVLSVLCSLAGGLSMASGQPSGKQGLDLEYLFAGMRQERAKLRSWSCLIKGVDTKNGPFEMELLSNADSFRFIRRPREANAKVLRVCDNGKIVTIWNEGEDFCVVSESTPSMRENFYLWDARTAGIPMGPMTNGIEETLKTRLEFWRKQKLEVERSQGKAVIRVAIPYEFGERRLTMSIDTDRGFTPTLFHADVITNDKSKVPGSVRVSNDLAAKWEQVGGIWVPTHHVETTGPQKVVTQEYHISWNWVNKEIDPRDFTIEALGIPAKARRVYMEKGREIPNTAEVPRSAFSRLMRLGGYATGALLCVIWIGYRFCARRKHHTS